MNTMNAMDFSITNESAVSSNRISIAFNNVGNCFLVLLILLIVCGNIIVLLTVCCDRKLRTITTNKFIASLAISDLLIGFIVMPLSLYAKVRSEKWDLGEEWCRFHLVSAIFATTASIVHLVAISIDRYFAIMFPTEYQRHSVSTSALPYVVMIWLMSLGVSSTLFLEKPLNTRGICWIEDPQYLVLSSFLSFFLPGAIVVYLYVKIFRKLQKHKLFMFGSTGLLRRRKSCIDKIDDRNRTLPEVIIEEVRSRRGSRMSQVSDCATRRTSLAASTVKSDRSPSQPEIHSIAVVQRRWRSPTICAEALEHDRTMASKKRVSICADPPSMDYTSAAIISRSATREIIQAECDDAMPKGLKINENENAERDQAVHLMVPRGVTFGACLSISEHSQCLLEVPHISPGLEKHEQQIAMAVSPKDETIAVIEHHQEQETECSLKRPLLSRPEATLRLDTSKTISNGTGNGYPGRVPNATVTQTLLSVPSAASLSASTLSSSTSDIAKESLLANLKVPKLWHCTSPTIVSSVPSSANSSRSSNSDDFYRRISMNSYGSSLTESDSAGDADSRRSSTWSTVRAAVLGGQIGCAVQGVIPTIGSKSGQFFIKKTGSPTRGKLRRIATQVTRAVRQKRRESIAMRRESRATRVVAAILIAFLICWIPYFCITVYRGICTGLDISIDKKFHSRLFHITSWLGFAHSCFNPIIYTSLNKSFRRRLRKLLRYFYCCKDLQTF